MDSLGIRRTHHHVGSGNLFEYRGVALEFSFDDARMNLLECGEVVVVGESIHRGNTGVQSDAECQTREFRRERVRTHVTPWL